ncbi:hypothetical protein CKO40_17785 [Halochromatium glycolicum]|uniref:Uncharacterized protein n=1 Tax=Halochromatium glycolicum TaxID=85075 RepID=A0AAJ0U8D1_9GAMM|nr:hypothetical protein [Halochromatium glycolicum]
MPLTWVSDADGRSAQSVGALQSVSVSGLALPGKGAVGEAVLTLLAPRPGWGGARSRLKWVWRGSDL